MMKHKRIRIAFFGVLTVALFAVFFVLSLNLLVFAKTRDRILTTDEVVGLDKDFDCILVLGAGVRNGEPSPMLADRLEIGVELYFADVCDTLLMSGDHMQADYDEVGAMKRYAIQAGVPSQCIFLDHAGLSTYESMWRAKNIYGARRVLIVTQEYHLLRAVYVAEQLGLEAYGVASDQRAYRGRLVREVREVAARVKDVFFTMTKPQPTYLGDRVDLAGDGDATNENPLLAK